MQIMNMNISILLAIAILLKCVIASEFGKTEIGQAIDDRNMGEVQRLCGQDKSLWEQASDYVVDTGDVDFIANFLKIGMLVTGYALLTLCRKHDIIDSVIGKIGLSFEDLVMKSAQADPILSLEKFMNLSE